MIFKNLTIFTQIKVRRVGNLEHTGITGSNPTQDDDESCMCCSVLLLECRGLAVGRYRIQRFEPNIKAGIRHFLKNLLLNGILIWWPESGGTLFCGAILWLQQFGSRWELKYISYCDLICPVVLTCLDATCGLCQYVRNLILCVE